MKKIYKLLLVAVAGASVVSCQDFLAQAVSPGTVDADFVFTSPVTAKTVIYGAYNSIRGTYNEGYPYNMDNIGSDTERCSVGIIADLVGAAQMYGGAESYTVENFNINGSIKGYWDAFYSAIAKCNQVITNIQARPDYQDILTNTPNEWSDILGQAYILRATMYWELIRHYGDCIYYSEAELGQDIKELTSRDCVVEKEIASAIKAEPYLYKIGQNGHMPDQITRNYADGLIARLCLEAAAYQTRRTDLGADFYVDSEGKSITFEEWGRDDARNAVYNRRSDWKRFYDIAIPYLEKAINDPGEAALTTADPRGTDAEGRVFDNPYQYYFEQMNDLIMPYESIFEITIKAEGGSSRIAYNFGRGSNGGGSNAYPPKANAQCCSYPEVFYGMFDPQDLRRDVSVNVTGSSGNGLEALYNYDLSNKNTLGIGLNKYDPNRQEMPDHRQLYSGINYILMRQADIILMLAEAYAVKGETAKATAELRKIHDRAFPAAVRDQKFNELLAANDNDLFKAIIDERKLEFVGETNRRWDLVRTGMLPDVIVKYRKTLVDHIAEMKANGYVQYPNGNQFPAYVWTKMYDAKKELGYRLTASTPAGLDPMSDKYAVLFPGYRGQHDDWVKVATREGKEASIKEGATNVAILGLTKFIPEDSAEAADLKARGYVKTSWGELQYLNAAGVPDPAKEAKWGSEFMIGYSDADYAAKKAPIYLKPMNENDCTTTGLTNGYGFKSKTK